MKITIILTIFRETHRVKRINLVKVREEGLWQNWEQTVNHFPIDLHLTSKGVSTNREDHWNKSGFNPETF